MNSLLEATSSKADNLAKEGSHESVVSRETEASKVKTQPCHRYRCQDCEHLSFSTRDEFENHLRTHIKLPDILVQRLNRSFVLQIKSNKGASTPRRGSFARKRVRSYIVPRVKNKNCGSLKLTLKRSQANTEAAQSFKVVHPKVLSGPGESFTLNGELLDEVKTENTSVEEDWAGSVEGSNRKQVEGGEVAASSRERTSDIAATGEESQDSKELDQESEEGEGGSDESDEIDDVCRETIEELKSLEIEEEKIIVDRSSPTTVAGLSPTPSEQLGPEFLPPEGTSTYPTSPAMVEINGSTIADTPSPAYPSTSPSAPSAPESDSQSGLNGDESMSNQMLSGSDQVRSEDQPEVGDSDSQSDFSWNNVSSTNIEGVHNDPPNTSALEDRDPLLLPDQVPPPPTSAGEEDSGVGMDLNQDPNSLEGGDSLLRGFLCEQPPDKTAVPVTNVGNIEGLGLGSEYISLERLGEGTMYCDVCGESAADSAGLEDHRVRAGHFKCNQAECGMVFPTGDELMGHQQTIHGNQAYGQPPLMNHQQAPVQQLVQQVQRLPVPQMPLQSIGQQPQQQQQQQQHSPQMVQQLASQLSPQLHTLMPPQQSQFQGQVRRPPPLYRVPAPVSMAPPGMQQQQQQHPPQYTGAQHMMYSQPYPPQGQGYPPGTQAPMQMHTRPYTSMIQQMNHQQTRPQMSHRMPGPGMPQRGGPVAQSVSQQGNSSSVGMKRANQSASSPNNKQRRLDVLIPDRHDDADCHVIAMQKRTDSGPVIGNVQGSSGGTTSNTAGRPESMIHLTDSITLSVRQPQGGATTSAPVAGGKNKSDAKAVANILATRGITVTPAGGTVRSSQNQSSPQRQVVNRAPPPPAPAIPPPPVATLNLNAAISIIPTASGRQNSRQQSSGNFSVPHGRSPARLQQQVERPPRPPTVDLTGDGPPSSNISHARARGRGRGSAGLSGRHTCQVCDKAFSTQESLNQHMTLHRSPGKLPYRCNLCSAQYPTQQGLVQHRQAYHKESAPQPGSELVLPVVDLKQPGTLSRLASLGVHHFIPLSQLSNQAGGYYGLPIVSVDGGRPPVCSMAGLGTSTVLSLGPIKQLPR